MFSHDASCIGSCMATKTITLEIDAYEKLKSAKRGDRESFSSVVRRANFLGPEGTGGAILSAWEAVPATMLPSEEVFSHWDRMQRENREALQISPSPWEDKE